MEGYLAGAARLSRPIPLDSSYITDVLLSAALIIKLNTQRQTMYVSGLLTTKKRFRHDHATGWVPDSSRPSGAIFHF